MSKPKKFSELNRTDAAAKHSALTIELVKAKVSMDFESIQHLGGMVGVRRDLRLLGRKLALDLKKEVKTND